MPNKCDEARHVVVTTEHRGVFFGRFMSEQDHSVVLADAQMCVYWPNDVQGVFGLAATGPTQGARVSRPVPRIELRGVTAVADATDEAVRAWQARPWS